MTQDSEQKNIWRGTRQETREIWPWVYFDLVENGPATGSQCKAKLAERIARRGGPFLEPKSFWDRLRSLDRMELVVSVPGLVELGEKAPLSVPKENPFEKLKRDNPQENPLRKLIEQNQPVPNPGPDRSSHIFDIVDLTNDRLDDKPTDPDSRDTMTTTYNITNVTTDIPEPVLVEPMPDVVIETALQADTIQQRLIAISRLADSILIEGIPEPASDRDTILARLGEQMEVSAKLYRERDSLSDKVYALQKRIDNLNLVNKRLEANISALTNNKPVDDRPFKEMQRLQSRAPGSTI